MPNLLSIKVSGNRSGYVSSTSQLSAIGTYSDGSTADLSGQVLWSTSNPGAATVGTFGLVTAIAPGTTIIHAALGSVSSPLVFNVPALVKTGLIIPGQVAIGQTAQFSLINTYSDGTTVDITDTGTWYTTDTSIATISSSGLLTALTAGSVEIGNYLAARSIKSSPYIILPAALISLVVSSPSSFVTIGSTLNLSVLGTYTDGHSADLTSSATWTAANPAAGVGLHTGVVTAQKVGLSVISASVGSVQGSITLNVFPAPDPNLQVQYRSYLTQVFQNYYDEKDVRVRESKSSIDFQLLNIPAQQLETSDRKFDREIKSATLRDCPVNIDSRGVYYRQNLTSAFDFSLPHTIIGTINGTPKTLVPFDDTLPVPTRVEINPEIAPVAMTSTEVFSFTGIGVIGSTNYATQRSSSVTLPVPGRLKFWIDGGTYDNLAVKVRITGQKYPGPTWANRQIPTSETITLLSFGYGESKFTWGTITEVQVSGLPVGVSIVGNVTGFLLPKQIDDRPYADSSARDVLFDRYWSYDGSLLKEEYLASNYQGYRYIQSYAVSNATGLAIEPNTSGIFLADKTKLYYSDRREPLPSNLSASALSAEPVYGLDVSIDETRTGALRYVLLRPIPYADAVNVSQYRYLVQTPTGTTYALTPDGVFAAYTSSAGWRRGEPIPLTIPLADIGTYVITLQAIGSAGTVLYDAVPYGNFAFVPKAQFDLSAIVPDIQGLSFDERGRLWAFTGQFAVPLLLHYDAYLLDEDSQALYLTDEVSSLVIDGVTI